MSQFAKRKEIAQANSTVPHMMIVARAGTGKTTTLVKGIRHLKGMSVDITPSEQQQQIWDGLRQSHVNSSVCFVAFNKSIQLKLERDISGIERAQAKTMHALGFGAVRTKFTLNREAVEGNRVRMIMEDLTGESWRNMDPVLLSGVTQIVGLLKMNLMEPTYDNMDAICSEFDIDLDRAIERVYEMVPEVLTECRDKVNHHGVIDHNDMIWLPYVHNLPLPKFDILLVDEAQDLNRCQQELALRMGRRIVFCGDPAQAIYGFAGADSNSMYSLQSILQDRGGCETYKLNITRRCGKAIVNEAKQYVDDFEYLDTNPDGEVSNDRYLPSTNARLDDSYLKKVVAGDMILCRVNAPLVSQFFRLLKQKKKATIIGRKIGENLINLINRFRAKTIEEFLAELETWYQKEQDKERAKKFPSEAKMLATADKRDCLECFAQGAETIGDMIATIDEVFSDQTGEGVTLSSIHKAKGLEADTVYLITPADIPFPHPMAKTAAAKKQEYNLRYVAITRAKNKFVYLR